ncbi:hypothetical protein [Rothia sp. (in: high G+C Gram-positive bacteria)]|uniref:hypothetical protein n=1 Tax=Rothia sp. (in: high G+C Gram-positive bacteria) TaxID=1885016 RepID=UPI003217C9AE
MPTQQPAELERLLKEHRHKATVFKRKAEKYIVPDEDVAKICSFYAAYHAMRVAILSDSIFDFSDEEIYRRAKTRGVYQDSKYNTHHSAGRDSGRGVGQNQIIASLYPKWSRDYEELHKLSIQARYVTDNSGEILPSANDGYHLACRIVDDALNGKIYWQPKPNINQL